MSKELSLEASLAYSTDDFKGVVKDFIDGMCNLLAESYELTVEIGKFNGVEGMITKRIELHDVVQKGFNALIENPAENVKILVRPM